MKTDKTANKSGRSTCPSCDGEFKCGFGGVFCWCALVRVSRETREEIAGEFSGCLCKDCLVAFSKGKELPESSTWNDS
ncbi:MAG: cysteine-rich CWC family protein [Aridibacter famidurans]|nr:cysteine-rich CWC family protein [Aridibacter famidurans]